MRQTENLKSHKGCLTNRLAGEARLERTEHPDFAYRQMPQEGLKYILKEMGYSKGNF